jgi:hypothetical protein
VKAGTHPLLRKPHLEADLFVPVMINTSGCNLVMVREIVSNNGTMFCRAITFANVYYLLLL